MKLVQNKSTFSLSYEITQTSLVVSFNSATEKSETPVPFENISDLYKKTYFINHDYFKPWLATLAAAVIATIVLLSQPVKGPALYIIYIAFVSMTILAYVKRKPYIIIQLIDFIEPKILIELNDSNNLEIYSFIKRLNEAKREFFLSHFPEKMKNLESEEVSAKLEFLLNNNIITQHEFNHLNIRIKYGR